MSPNPELDTGDLILDGKYRVEAFVGAGGFAQVYRVRHLDLQVDRAVKVVSRTTPGVGSTTLDEFRGRFQLEARLGATVDHPRVIRVHDFDETEGRLYLTMEYAPGGSLAQRLRERGALPVEGAVRIVLEVAAGLEAIHTQLRAIHRDVKPSNILFDAEGRTKVADLGLAQVRGGPSRRQTLGSAAPAHPGTPEYMSPEQVRTLAFLSRSSDVYSLGCVLFEMLTGRLWKEAMVEVERPGELRPEVPGWLDEVVVRMLRDEPGRKKADADDPHKRYVTMRAVREAMEAGQRRGRLAALAERAEVALAQQAWEELRSIISKLQKIDTETAEPFAEALATHEEEQRQQQLAAWYTEAEQSVADDPERTLELVAKIESEEADYAGLAELSQPARLVQQAREREEVEQWLGAAQAYRQALEQTQGEAPWRSAIEERLRHAEKEARRERLYRDARNDLDDSDWTSAIETLETLLDEAPAYRDAGELLSQAQAGLQRQQLRAAAQSALEKQAWEELQQLVVELEEIEAKDAEPFARALADHDAAEDRQQRQLSAWYAEAEKIAESNPEKALRLLNKIRDEDPSFPALSELQERIETALSEQERQQRIAAWYAEAKRLAEQNPQKATGLIRQIEEEDPNHSGLISLRNRVEEAQQAKKARSRRQTRDEPGGGYQELINLLLEQLQKPEVQRNLLKYAGRGCIVSLRIAAMLVFLTVLVGIVTLMIRSIPIVLDLVQISAIERIPTLTRPQLRWGILSALLGLGFVIGLLIASNTRSRLVRAIFSLSFVGTIILAILLFLATQLGTDWRERLSLGQVLLFRRLALSRELPQKTIEIYRTRVAAVELDKTVTPTEALTTPTTSPTPQASTVITSENAHQVNERRRLGLEQIQAARWSPNGDTLAVATRTGVYLYDAKILEKLLSIETGSWVYSVAFGPNNKTLAFGGWENIVELWDVINDRSLQTLKGHSLSVLSISFNPDGTMLASAGGATVRIWDTTSGELQHSLKESKWRVTSVTFSPDGRILASSSDDGTVRIWSVDTNRILLWESQNIELLHTLEGHTSSAVSLSFSPDGTILASGDEKNIRLWDIESGQLLKTLEGHTAPVNSVAFSPDGTILVSGASDKTVRLWDVQSSQLLKTLEGHTDAVRSVAFNPSGTILVSGSLDETLRFWRLPE